MERFSFAQRHRAGPAIDRLMYVGDDLSVDLANRTRRIFTRAVTSRITVPRRITPDSVGTLV